MANRVILIPPADAILAQNTLRRKVKRTALEDALAAGDGNRAVILVRWAREQFSNYQSNLISWRENRRRYEQEAADVFEWRKVPNVDEAGKPKVFQLQNDSLNIIAGLAEFASAQAEQDIVGADPWFAVAPVGLNDNQLAEDMQKHLQWTHRDGRQVERYCSAITRAACLGESFTLPVYEREIDNYEAEISVLHANGKPVLVEGAYLKSAEEAQAMADAGKLPQLAGAELTWDTAYEKRSEVRFEGIETLLLPHTDVAFREDAPQLDLKHTNFYFEFELTVLEAMSRFNLKKEDAMVLAETAGVKMTVKDEHEETRANKDSPGAGAVDAVDLGSLEEEKKLNTRVRLVGGFVRVDPFGKGQSSDLFVVFTSGLGVERLWYGNYLSNVSPKGELPVKVHVWEKVPNRLYGRGFFAKYAHVQKQVDDLWNQISFRNGMHANPLTAVHKENIQSEDDDADVLIGPGTTIEPLPGKKLADCIEFAQLPDLDKRSMELMQIGIQMAQLRSGMTAASQGDLSSVPENNTATGIRQLMSRAAVLLKKPIRGLRRSLGGDFSYSVKLFYANFDRTETFLWGEGEKAELVSLSADQVRDLDIDCRMLLTQEQNSDKLAGSQAATGMFMQYVQLQEVDKSAGRPLFLQAIKALQFEQADEIIRPAILTLEAAIALLPPDEQKRAISLLQAGQAAQSLSPQSGMPMSAPPAGQTQTPPPSTP